MLTDIAISHLEDFITEKISRQELIKNLGKEFKYEEVEMLGDAYVKIGAEGKYGAANLKGELIVPIQYDSIDYDDYNKTVIAIIKTQ